MPTRQELLVQCQAAGLKATGWKKEKMALELAKLAAPEDTSEAPSDEKPVTASSLGADSSSDPEEEEKEDRLEPANRQSGWCSRTALWSRTHLTCQDRVERDLLSTGCRCECHKPDWVRPEIPDGAQLSKYNREDREPLGLPWEPKPGERVADAIKLAKGGDDDGADRSPVDPGDAVLAGMADLVGAAAGPAGEAEPE